MFSPDKPITSYKKDILGRRTFAKSLGDAILNYRDKDSVVIGLYGAWGSGKTSIINMAIEHIKKVTSNRNNSKKPIIVEFNPWNFSDQNQLIHQFFAQLSKALKRPDHSMRIQSAGEKIIMYSRFLEPLTFIPAISFAKPILNLLAKLGWIAKELGDRKSKNLKLIKSELNNLLIEQPQRIIIVIDDIDRLNNTEIRQIFQLIKSLGNFSNTVYLVAFDKEVIIRALKKVQEGSGVEYLEKVVQIPFEIPLISKFNVEKLLFERLDEILENLPENKWDKQRWENIYHGGLKHFFTNIRHVIRYTNSLRFGYELVKGEVNAIDFFAITALQVFLPDLYYGIRENKDVFAGIRDSRMETTEEQEGGFKKECDRILQKAAEFDPKSLKDLLKRLFPKLESVYGDSNYGYDWLEDWRKDCRICSPEIFDTYFKLAVPEEEISQKEIEQVLSSTHDSEALSEALLKFNTNGKILKFLERFEDYTREVIPEKDIETVVTVLMDIGDLFPKVDPSLTIIDTPNRITRIIHQLVHRFASSEKRFSILKPAMEKAERSLFTIVHLVIVHNQQHGKHKPEGVSKPKENLTVDLMQYEQLKRLACEKIETWAKNSSLSNHKYLQSILLNWKNWTQDDKAEDYVKNLIVDDIGLINLIAIFAQKAISHGMKDYVGKTSWKISIENIEKLVAVKEIESRIRGIYSSSKYKELDDMQRIGINTFLDTLDKTIEDYP